MAEPTTIEDERAALRAQHAALEDLKRQLSERVEAVRERELELHHALAEKRPAAGTPRLRGPAADAAAAASSSACRRLRGRHRRERGSRHSVASRRSPSVSGPIAAAEVALLARTRQLEQDLAR